MRWNWQREVYFIFSRCFFFLIFLSRKAVACETDSLCFYISVISNILGAPIFLLKCFCIKVNGVVLKFDEYA